ncbi:tripartite tricarboxylate transporter substrate binding protein [Caenimonas sedimenti]|uniref:Tripartite tricarboxylate transporter substrate binding protein n=1 Tax=Caenimonas sedimenti TaxID=2596921 RepID=A0A562ZQ33_9BURK|nr:tripartite tricarboxylate transporter substrate-binding protein [Caenimonas sedimenti]TWO70643.1 tripartite tricarboxylate transporter substrate binding protein [Caenimonas sedimenti]
MRHFQFAIGLMIGALAQLAAAAPAQVECIAPAKPGGGFDLTCQLLKQALALPPGPATDVQVRYMPGGIGAVVFDRAVTQNWSDPAVFVAFSTGSLLNLVQGKFGPHGPQDVRWLATLGTEYGVVAVRKDSRFATLPALMQRLRENASGAVFGAGGAVGSQDWVKASLLVRAAGRDHRTMRFVSFEGGGQAIAALRGGHVDVFCGDAGEAMPALAAGEIRLLAVLAPQRQRGTLAGVPTAREQGVDLVWPTVRGIYMGPGVPAKDLDEWTRILQRVMKTPAYEQAARASGMEPLALAGPELQEHVQREAQRMRELARSLHLTVR